MRAGNESRPCARPTLARPRRHPAGPSSSRFFRPSCCRCSWRCIDQTIVATALPAIAGSLGGVERVSWIVVVLPDRHDDRRPRLRPPRRPARPAADDVRGAGRLHRRIDPVRARHSVEFLTIARVAAGARRRRAHDAVAGADRRDGAAARARPLPGIPRRQSPSTSSTFGPVGGGFLTEHFGWTVGLPRQRPARQLAPCCSRLRLRAIPARAQPFRFDPLGLASSSPLRGAAPARARAGAAPPVAHVARARPSCIAVALLVPAHLAGAPGGARRSFRSRCSAIRRSGAAMRWPPATAR